MTYIVPLSPCGYLTHYCIISSVQRHDHFVLSRAGLNLAGHMLGTIMPPTNTCLVTLGKEMLSSDGHYLKYTAAGVRYLERNYSKVLFY